MRRVQKLFKLKLQTLGPPPPEGDEKVIAGGPGVSKNIKMAFNCNRVTIFYMFEGE